MEAQTSNIPFRHEEFNRRTLRVAEGMIRLFLLNRRESAALLGLSKRQYLRFARSRDSKVTRLEAGKWYAFFRFFGISLDIISDGSIGRAQALTLQGRVIREDVAGCASIFRARLSRLLFGRLENGLQNPWELQMLDLEGDDLSNCDLSDSTLTLSNGRNTDFNGTRLKNAYLGWMNLENARMNHADLRGAKMPWSVLCGADLSTANLDGADLFDAVYDEETRLPFGRLEATARGMQFVSRRVWNKRAEYLAHSSFVHQRVVMKTAREGGIKRLCQNVRMRRALRNAGL